ncbi:MAG: hypothetical protein K2P68_01345 [Sphingomonas sp.]|nr:hypothetical protein [Sphingomonas sp.]
MKTIDQLIDEVIAREGDYSNHPSDRGGPTRWGITEAVARQQGYSGDMRQLPRAEAAAIYKRLYWLRPGFAAVQPIAPKIASELFDTGINMGVGTAGQFLQRALNALNRNGRDFADLKVDGNVGPGTLSALSRFMAVRGAQGEAVLLKALDALQGERYVNLAESRPANEDFVFGWLSNRIGQVA